MIKGRRSRAWASLRIAVERLANSNNCPLGSEVMKSSGHSKPRPRHFPRENEIGVMRLS